MAPHAFPHGRKSRHGRPVCEGVTIHALHFQVLDVDLVVKGDGLFWRGGSTLRPNEKPDANDEEKKKDPDTETTLHFPVASLMNTR